MTDITWVVVPITTITYPATRPHSHLLTPHVRIDGPTLPWTSIFGVTSIEVCIQLSVYDSGKIKLFILLILFVLATYERATRTVAAPNKKVITFEGQKNKYLDLKFRIENKRCDFAVERAIQIQNVSNRSYTPQSAPDRYVRVETVTHFRTGETRWKLNRIDIRKKKTRTC